MKKLLIILILITSFMDSQAQNDYYSHKLTKKNGASLLIDIASITTDAMGDAYYDMGRKDLGHALNAASVGMLVAQPFIIDFSRDDWKWKVPAYILLRFAVFDAVYNTTRGNQISQLGTTSLYDNTLNKMYGGDSVMLPKGISFIVGISITLRYGK